MAHARQTIREAIVTALTGLATTGSRVFDSHVYTFEATPSLFIYEKSGETEIIDHERTTLGGRVRRELHLMTDGLAKPTEAAAISLEDQLDTICAEVETVLGGGAPSLGLILEFVGLVRTGIQYVGELERPAGRASMEWVIRYHTLANAPGTIVP